MSVYLPGVEKLSDRTRAEHGLAENELQLHLTENQVRARQALENGDWNQDASIFKDAHEGNVKKVEEYLKLNKKGVHIKSNIGISLFQVAVQGGHLEVVKLIVNSQREKLQAFSKDEQSSALSLALVNKNLPLAKYLIEQGVNAKGCSPKTKMTPLMHAAKGGDEEIVELLISKKLINKRDIDATDVEGLTALMWASCKGVEPSVHRIYEKHMVSDNVFPKLLEESEGRIAEAESKSRFDHATTQHQDQEEDSKFARIVEMLLKNKADPTILDIKGRNALIFGVIARSSAIVDILLNNDAVKSMIDHFSKEGVPALYFALIGGVNALFFRLLAAGASPNDMGRTLKCSSLHVAIQYTRNIKVFEALLERTPDIEMPDASGGTILHYVASARWEACIQLLISKGALVNKRGSNGETPLRTIASFDELLNSTKLLLASKADVNLADNEGYTPLMAAASNGAINTIKTLIEADADLYARNKDGDTALMFAASSGNLEAVQVLIVEMQRKGRVELEVVNNVGANALILAIESKSDDPELLRILVDTSSFELNRSYIIKYKAKDRHYEACQTALMRAARSGKEKMIEFLLARGADPCFTNKVNNSSLKNAVLMGTFVSVSLILNAMLLKIDQNRDVILSDIVFAIYVAAGEDKVEMLKILLKALESQKKDDIEDLEKTILTCLKKACENKSKNVLKFFVSDEHCLEIINRYANDLLQEAVSNNHLAMSQFLLESALNVDINLKRRGLGLLLIAIMKRNPSMVHFLLEKGIDIEGVSEIPMSIRFEKNPHLESDPNLEQETESDGFINHSVTALMLSSIGILINEDGTFQQITYFKNEAIAALILAKKIWNALENNYIKELKEKLPVHEQNAFIVDMKKKILQFSKALVGLGEPFDINEKLNISKRDTNTGRIKNYPLSFLFQLDILKEIHNIQKEKGNFNFDKLRSFIFSLIHRLIRKDLQGKEEALEQANKRRLQFLSKISVDAAKFPYLTKSNIQRIETLQGNQETLKNNPSLIQRLLAEITASNMFLVSKAGLFRLNSDTVKLSGLKERNNRLKARIERLLQEMIELKNDLQALKKQYVARFLALASKIQEILENKGIEAAEQSLTILNEDPLLLDLKKEGAELEAMLSQIPDEFVKIEKDLISQREKEKTGERVYLEKRKQEKLEESETQKFAKLQDDLKRKLEDEELRLKEELKKEEETLRLQKAALRARKEGQRRFALAQTEERKGKKEKELLSKEQGNSQANITVKERKLGAEACQTAVVSNDHKQGTERQSLRREEERRNRLFPLTLASKSGLMVLLGLSPEARVLKEIMDDIEILSKHDFLQIPADKLGARLACLGMMERIMEIIFRNGGFISTSAKDAEHFRDVISHSKNSFLEGFADEEIFKLTDLMVQYVFAVLTNDKVKAPKFFSLLTSNKTYIAFLKHDLEKNKEPFAYEVYESERKLAKEQENQLRNCLVLSLTQLEHANGYCVGRIGGFIRRLMRYHRNHPDLLRAQAGFEQDLTSLRSREEMESYLLGGREYRHAETSAAGFEVTERLERIQMSLNGQACRDSNPSAAGKAQPSTPHPAPSRSFLPAYEEDKPKPNQNNAGPSPFSSTSGLPGMKAEATAQPSSTSVATPLAAANASLAANAGKKKKKGKKKGKK